MLEFLTVVVVVPSASASPPLRAAFALGRYQCQLVLLACLDRLLRELVDVLGLPTAAYGAMADQAVVSPNSRFNQSCLAHFPGTAGETAADAEALHIPDAELDHYQESHRVHRRAATGIAVEVSVAAVNRDIGVGAAATVASEGSVVTDNNSFAAAIVDLVYLRDSLRCC